MRPSSIMLLDDPANKAGLLASYGRALSSLGCHVTFWNIHAAEQRQARMGALGARLQSFVTVGPWLRRFSRDLVVAVLEQKPDLVVAINVAPVTSGALAQIRASAPNTQLVLLWPDPLQNMLDTTVQALPMYDLIATYSESSVAPLLRLGARRVECVPFAYDRELFGLGGAKTSDAEYSCDVGFIGNVRPEREQALAALHRAGIQVKIWGSSQWPRSANSNLVRSCYRGGPLIGADFAVATRAFRLALNVIDRTNFPAPNMRFFETLGAGGTLLSSPCPEARADFPEGVAAFYYGSEDELVARVRALLPSVRERRAVADEGQRRVLAQHTYVHRARQLLRALDPGPDSSSNGVTARRAENS